MSKIKFIFPHTFLLIFSTHLGIPPSIQSYYKPLFHSFVTYAHPFTKTCHSTPYISLICPFIFIISGTLVQILIICYINYQQWTPSNTSYFSPCHFKFLLYTSIRSCNFSRENGNLECYMNSNKKCRRF